eukprot:gene1013-604_t
MSLAKRCRDGELWTWMKATHTFCLSLSLYNLLLCFFPLRFLVPRLWSEYSSSSPLFVLSQRPTGASQIAQELPIHIHSVAFRCPIPQHISRQPKAAALTATRLDKETQRTALPPPMTTASTPVAVGPAHGPPGDLDRAEMPPLECAIFKGQPEALDPLSSEEPNDTALSSSPARSSSRSDRRAVPPAPPSSRPLLQRMQSRIDHLESMLALACTEISRSNHVLAAGMPPATGAAPGSATTAPATEGPASALTGLEVLERIRKGLCANPKLSSGASSSPQPRADTGRYGLSDELKAFVNAANDDAHLYTPVDQPPQNPSPSAAALGALAGPLASPVIVLDVTSMFSLRPCAAAPKRKQTDVCSIGVGTKEAVVLNRYERSTSPHEVPAPKPFPLPMPGDAAASPIVLPTRESRTTGRLATALARTPPTSSQQGPTPNPRAIPPLEEEGEALIEMVSPAGGTPLTVDLPDAFAPAVAPRHLHEGASRPSALHLAAACDAIFTTAAGPPSLASMLQAPLQQTPEPEPPLEAPPELLAADNAPPACRDPAPEAAAADGVVGPSPTTPPLSRTPLRRECGIQTDWSTAAAMTTPLAQCTTPSVAPPEPAHPMPATGSSISISCASPTPTGQQQQAAPSDTAATAAEAGTGTDAAGASPAASVGFTVTPTILHNVERLQEEIRSAQRLAGEQRKRVELLEKENRLLRYRQEKHKQERRLAYRSASGCNYPARVPVFPPNASAMAADGPGPSSSRAAAQPPDLSDMVDDERMEKLLEGGATTTTDRGAAFDKEEELRRLRILMRFSELKKDSDQLEITRERLNDIRQEQTRLQREVHQREVKATELKRCLEKVGDTLLTVLRSPQPVTEAEDLVRRIMNDCRDVDVQLMPPPRFQGAPTSPVYHTLEADSSKPPKTSTVKAAKPRRAPSRQKIVESESSRHRARVERISSSPGTGRSEIWPTTTQEDSEREEEQCRSRLQQAMRDARTLAAMISSTDGDAATDTANGPSPAPGRRSRGGSATPGSSGGYGAEVVGSSGGVGAVTRWNLNLYDGPAVGRRQQRYRKGVGHARDTSKPLQAMERRWHSKSRISVSFSVAYFSLSPRYCVPRQSRVKRMPPSPPPPPCSSQAHMPSQQDLVFPQAQQRRSLRDGGARFAPISLPLFYLPTLPHTEGLQNSRSAFSVSPVVVTTFFFLFLGSAAFLALPDTRCLSALPGTPNSVVRRQKNKRCRALLARRQPLSSISISGIIDAHRPYPHSPLRDYSVGNPIPLVVLFIYILSHFGIIFFLFVCSILFVCVPLPSLLFLSFSSSCRAGLWPL